MDGQPYRVTRFAATLRRMLFREHLGLIPPQMMDVKNEEVTDYMRPAPTPNPDELGTREDEMVADPLCEETQYLWNDTARKNREIFTEIFRPVPTNLVRTWDAYDVRCCWPSMSVGVADFLRLALPAEGQDGSCHAGYPAAARQGAPVTGPGCPGRGPDRKQCLILGPTYKLITVSGLPHRREGLRRRPSLGWPEPDAADLHLRTKIDG